ncbi:MAG: NAD(P)/FAD-dependent oxidoreductase [Flavobacteriales bacterium]|nr:NAD(P)/FAD-dependent oxidoreductase [Flavobacteriales bacterium]
MKIAIIGAGAAGCFAAANIDSEKHHVQLFEKSRRALQKVHISGGGRCNLTNYCFNVDELITHYPRGKHFLRRTLHRFSPAQTMQWFEDRGVKLKVEKDGRVFPASNSSQTIIDCLLKNIESFIQYEKELTAVAYVDQHFILHFSDKTSAEADRLLIAPGGFQKATQYAWLEKLGHGFENPVPSLFTFNIPHHPLLQLQGVSLPNVCIHLVQSRFTQSGPVLITHWGMSGPAVLRLSAWAAKEISQLNYQFDISVNWLNDMTESQLRAMISKMRAKAGKQHVIRHNPFLFPCKFWKYLCVMANITDQMKWGEIPGMAQNELIDKILRDKYTIDGKTTFKEEFVTCGGIKLNEINPATMESRLVPGLFFAGEIMDIDGVTGGFNFQHAWSSGWIASHAMQASTEIKK